MMLDDVRGCWSAGFTGCTRGVGRTCFESDGPTDEVRHLSSEGSSMMLDDVGGCWSAVFTGCTRGVDRTCFESDGPTDEVRQLSSKVHQCQKMSDVGLLALQVVLSEHASSLMVQLMK